jgi:hypothetical protein
MKQYLFKLRLLRDKTIRVGINVGEEFEDTKEAIRIRISKKNKQNSGQKKKHKKLSTKHTYKTKDRVKRTPVTIKLQ